MKRMWTDKKIAEISSAVAAEEIEDATIESSQISSGEATEGKVLTADGEGGVSWEDAGGGDLYVHNIRVLATYNGVSNVAFWIKLYLPFETKFATVGDLADYLYSHGADSYKKNFALASSELTTLVKDGNLRVIGACYPFVASAGGALNIFVNYSEAAFAIDGTSITISNGSKGGDYITSTISRSTSLSSYYYVMSV